MAVIIFLINVFLIVTSHMWLGYHNEFIFKGPPVLQTMAVKDKIKENLKDITGCIIKIYIFKEQTTKL